MPHYGVVRLRIHERWRREMIEFMKFIGGVVLSAAIIAPAFAFILKSFAHISGSKPTAVPATPERSGSAKRTRAGR